MKQQFLVLLVEVEEEGYLEMEECAEPYWDFEEGSHFHRR